MYRCIASINKSALLSNLSYIKKISDNAEIVFMVKANAYGHGLKEVALILQDYPDIYFGVAALEEAKILRKYHVRNPILLFDGGAFIGEARDLIEFNITPVITSFAAVKSLADEIAKSEAKPHKIHVKIDTGFVRNGLYFADVLEGKHDDFLTYLRDSSVLEVEGIATHFCCADVAIDTFSSIQIAEFNRCIKYLKDKSLPFAKIHMANSAAILAGMTRLDSDDGTHQIMVRPGLAAYGISPKPSDACENLQPVMQIKAQVVALKKLKTGQGIGYGHSFLARSDTTVAIVAMGYGDGLKRSLSNIGHMIVNGIRVPIVGTISMDSCAIDISEVLKDRGDESVQVGHMVTVVGVEGSEEISIKMLAEQTGTVTWEILTSMAERLPRKVV